MLTNISEMLTNISENAYKKLHFLKNLEKSGKKFFMLTNFFFLEIFVSISKKFVSISKKFVSEKKKFVSEKKIECEI